MLTFKSLTQGQHVQNKILFVTMVLRELRIEIYRSIDVRFPLKNCS